MVRVFLPACALWLLLVCVNVDAEDQLFPFVISYENPENVTNISHWLERPAGKDGFVRVRDGRLATDRGPIRFWATNFCFDACFPSHEQAERVAERLARFGINCVRMHHMDSRSIWGDSPDKLTIDPQRLERLDYLIYQLKQHGVYVNINLHVSRWFGPSEEFVNQQQRPKYDKGLDNFEPRMIELQKRYARDLLTHVNPYTGNPYTREPAVAFIEINNENALFAEWSRRHLDSLPDPYATTFREQWNAWLRAKYGDTDGLRDAWDVGSWPLGDELLKNGDFSGPLERNWTMEQDDQTQVEWSVEKGGPADEGALRIVVGRQGTIAWHPQLSQSGFAVRKDHPYTVVCSLRSDQAATVGLNCMMAHDPWQRLGFSTNIATGPQWKTFRFTFVATDDDKKARLTVTGLKPGTYELASVSIRLGGIVGLQKGQSLEDDSVPVLHRGEMNLTESARNDFIDFLWDTEWKYWQEMAGYVRDDLQAVPPVSGTQLSYSPVYCQSALDYIDAHSYWQHPRFPGHAWDSKNWYIENVALVNSAGSTLSSLAARRVAGLPFTVSEYNHPVPNQYAAEGFPMLSAMAAFQGWDGLFAFAYCHNADFEPQRLGSYFDIKSDPVKLAHLPACVAMFVRGDVSEAKRLVTAPISRTAERDKLHETHDPWSLTTESFGVPSRLALQHAIALARQTAEATATKAAGAESPAPQIAEDATTFVSDTGQLRWDVSQEDAGYFIADSPRTKLFSGFVRKRRFSLGDVHLEIGATRLDWATISLVCIDGIGFDQPGRILVAATGWMQNTGANLEKLDGNRVTLQNGWGDAPILCEGIPATIRLPVPADRVSCYALDTSGNRRGAVITQAHDGQAAIQLAPEHQTIWYELVIR